MAQSRSSRHPLFVYSAPLGGGGGGVAVEEEKKIKERETGICSTEASGCSSMAGSRDTAKGRGCVDPSVKGGGRAALGNAEEVERVFRHFDANGDGRISASELADVVRALSGSDGGAASDDEVRQMMEEMDADRDGYIDLAEFVEFHCGRGGGGSGRGAAGAGDGEKELREAFRMYDLNGDGLISARELHQVLKRLGDKCSVRDCSRMINSVDADGDGSVNFQEFKKMMTNPGSNGGANSGKNRCRQPPNK